MELIYTKGVLWLELRSIPFGFYIMCSRGCMCKACGKCEASILRQYGSYGELC